MRCKVAQPPRTEPAQNCCGKMMGKKGENNWDVRELRINVGD
jgi:hypothetical protein